MNKDKTEGQFGLLGIPCLFLLCSSLEQIKAIIFTRLIVPSFVSTQGTWPLGCPYVSRHHLLADFREGRRDSQTHTKAWYSSKVP